MKLSVSSEINIRIVYSTRLDLVCCLYNHLRASASNLFRRNAYRIGVTDAE